MSGWIEIINTDISTPFTGAVMDDMVFTTALSNQRICFASGSNTVPVMTVSNNQVGIGTMTPQATMHVAGSAYFTSNMTIGQNLIMRGMQIERRDVAGPYNITTRITNVEGFSNTGGTIAITASNGSNINMTGLLTTQKITLQNNQFLAWKNKDGGDANIFAVDVSNTLKINSAGQTIFINPDSSTYTDINYNNTGNVQVFHGTTAVLVKTGARIGICTSSPSTTLHVNGDATVNSNMTVIGVLAGNGSGVSNLNGSYISAGSINASYLPVGDVNQKGIIQLEDSTNSSSTSKAATPNSVKSAYDLANGALSRSSGGTLNNPLYVNSTVTANTLGVGTSSPSFTTHIVGSLFVGDINYASTTIPSGASISSTYNSYRLVFDNTFNDTSRANKIVLHNASGMLGGFGIRTGAVTYHSGDAHSFYSGATSSVDGNLRVKFGDAVAVTVYGGFYFNGAPAGTLYTDGNGLVYAASDKRAKFNIEYLDQDVSSIEKIIALKPARFELKSDPGKPRCGFITQDVDQFIPEAVDGRKYQFYFRQDRDGKTVIGDDGEPVLDLTRPRYQALDTTAILAHVVGAFKELHTEVVELRREINALKNA